MLRLQKLLVALGLAGMALPLPLLLVFQRVKDPGNWTNVALNRTLVGVPLSAQDVPAAKSSLLDKQYQKSVEDWVNQNYAFREAFIRGYNQVLWSVFGKSYMADESIIRGRGGVLYEDSYLREYNYISWYNLKQIGAFCDSLDWIKDKLAARGVPFVVLITPSKPRFVPEAIPARYTNNVKGQPPDDYELFVEQLKGHRIPFVDGHAETVKAEGRLPLGVYPKNGIHWRDQAAFFTAESLLRECESVSRKPLAHLAMGPITIDDRVSGSDCDLGELLNLVHPPTDQSMHARFSVAEGSPRGTGQIAIVGGSYVGQIFNILKESEACRRISWYFYNRRILRYPEAAGTDDVSSLSDADWGRDIYGADVVVLEINESYVDTNRAHVLSFMRDLQSRPAPGGAPGGK